MNYIKKHLKRIIPTILLMVGIVLAFFGFLNGNRKRIATQDEEYLFELTSQRAISVDSLFSENLGFIRTTAYLYGESLSSPEADVEIIGRFEENSVFDLLRFVDASGDNYTSQGMKSNLADRDYFQDGMRGGTGVTYVAQSRVTGERQIGFYAPVHYKDEIIGIMVGFYGEDYIQHLLEYELFEYTGEGWLCARDGTVLGTTAADPPENFLAYMQDSGRMTASQTETLAEAMAAGESTSFLYESEEDTAVGYAAALTQKDWILIRNFPPSASAQILRNANQEGFALIAELVLLFIAYVLVLAFGVLMDQRRLREANRNATDVSTGVSRLFDRFASVDLREGTYTRISGPEEGLPTAGPYEELCDNLLSRIPDEAQRRETAAAIQADNLRQALSEEDRVSFRVHAPVQGDEWYTYNFIALEREKNTPVRMLIASQDVTALHHREETEQQRLQQALDAAEKASRAKTDFLFNMSHDLRTPMNAIIGYTGLAQRAGVTPDQMYGYVQKIDASSQHLLALINDILEMSRIESGKMTLDPQPMDLVQTMEEMRQLFATQMEQKGIRFTVDAGDVRDRYVLCDKNRLNRVLLNLLSNASKFTEAGGQVTAVLRQTDKKDAAEERAQAPVGPHRAESRGPLVRGEGSTGDGPVQAETAGIRQYELRVADTGIGMSQSFAEKLFQPFERERTSTVSGIQGTGLGLSITKSIVDLMGGSIAVHTAQGEGTEFVLWLAFPAADGAAAGMAGSETKAGLTDTGSEDIDSAISVRGDTTSGVLISDPDFSRYRLLLAEDNDINREIALMILTQEGFAVDAVVNGQEAVDRIRESAPGTYDAVLMDIQMPVLNGYDAARAIRALEDPEKADVPILAMTANAFAEDVQAAKDAGMNGHIAKPLDVGKMMETLKGVLRA